MGPEEYAIANEKITDREREVLRLAALGRTDKQIANELDITTHTVSTYWKRLRKKFQAASRSEIIASALRAESSGSMMETQIQVERLLFELGERARIEEELKAKDLQLQLIMQQMPTTVWVTDTDLRIQSILGGAAEGLGFLPELIIGETLYAIFPDEGNDFPPIKAHLQALTGEEAGYMRTREDNILIDLRVRPLKSHDGEIIGVVGAVTNITEAIQRVLDLMPSALLTAKETVAILDDRGQIAYINHGWPGIQREGMFGRNIFDYVAPQHHDILKKAIQTVYKNGDTAETELLRFGQNDNYIPFTSILRPLKVANRIVAAILVSRPAKTKNKLPK